LRLESAGRFEIRETPFERASLGGEWNQPSDRSSAIRDDPFATRPGIGDQPAERRLGFAHAYGPALGVL